MVQILKQTEDWRSSEIGNQDQSKAKLPSIEAKQNYLLIQTQFYQETWGWYFNIQVPCVQFLWWEWKRGVLKKVSVDNSCANHQPCMWCRRGSSDKLALGMCRTFRCQVFPVQRETEMCLSLSPFFWSFLYPLIYTMKIDHYNIKCCAI